MTTLSTINDDTFYAFFPINNDTFYTNHILMTTLSTNSRYYSEDTSIYTIYITIYEVYSIII